MSGNLSNKRILVTQADDFMGSALCEVLAAHGAEVTDDRDVVIITRRGAEDVALISASELAGILETAHLLRSPKNADRLLTALNRARARSGTSQSPAGLRRELGLDE